MRPRTKVRSIRPGQRIGLAILEALAIVADSIKKANLLQAPNSNSIDVFMNTKSHNVLRLLQMYERANAVTNIKVRYMSHSWYLVAHYDIPLEKERYEVTMSYNGNWSTIMEELP